MEAAKAGFAETGADVSLEEIARRAGVGIGTLYRHFPTRDAMVEAVYRRELDRFADAAPRLLAELRPAEALHEWMRLFVDYIATKKVMAEALNALVGGAAAVYAGAGAGNRITQSMTLLVRASIEAGQIRHDADPADLLRALVGFAYGNAGEGWKPSVLRLIDILMAGLRAQ